MFCLLPVTDPASKTVTFVRFDKIRENIPLSQDQDWTDSLDKNQRSMISYRFPGYAQNNWFHYKADKTVSDGYGDGLIVVNDTTLDLTKDQFTLPFAASEDMAWHSQPILKIPLADSSYKIDTEVQPRIFQCYTEDALTSFIQIDYTDGTTTTTITTDVGFAYFSRSGKDENLDFQGSLIPEFYGTITDILSNTKIIDDIFFITESMINSFDPTVPIYLNVSNSIKTISGYFYVNVINNYLPFRPTKVQLIRL